MYQELKDMVHDTFGILMEGDEDKYLGLSVIFSGSKIKIFSFPKKISGISSGGPEINFKGCP